mgnify:CR=1 FL=1
MKHCLKLILLFFLLGYIFPFSVLAHPGNTNASGCHVCKTNCSKWGLKNNEYHCHTEKIKTTKIDAKTKAKNKSK